MYNGRHNMFIMICINYVTGDIVISQFSGDGRWYRARVLSCNETNPPTYDVTYIDYGNTEPQTIDRLDSTFHVVFFMDINL